MDSDPDKWCSVNGAYVIPETNCSSAPQALSVDEGVATRDYTTTGPNNIITPRAHARARGYVIGRGVYIYIVSLDFFWNQSFISQNTHFQRSILTQIGFSSNLMASSTA